jgi:sugar phosphate isomerase/epimerase
MTIYVSTGGFSGAPAHETARVLRDSGIRALELSGGRHAESLITELTKLRSDIRFQVHNYFPPPKEPFVLNLGSLNPNVAARSLAHVERALDCCRAVGADHYSFHAGFLLDPRVDELGRPIAQQNLFSRDECINVFIERVASIATRAAAAGVRVMVENNVLSSRNARRFDVNPLLMCEPAECRALMRRMPENVGMLLDVAHLKVSARSLGFDPAAMFRECGDWIRGYHLSDNDGLEDSNLPYSEDSWFWKFLNPDVEYISVEVYRRSAAELATLTELAGAKLSNARRK